MGSREDISYAIIKSQHRNAAGILDLWKEIEDDYPYLEELSSLLARYDFSIYQDVEQEREFALVFQVQKKSDNMSEEVLVFLISLIE